MESRVTVSTHTVYSVRRGGGEYGFRLSLCSWQVRRTEQLVMVPDLLALNPDVFTALVFPKRLVDAEQMASTQPLLY